MKKQIISAVCAFGLACTVLAQSSDVKTLTGPKNYNELIKNGAIKIIHEEGKDDLMLLPQTEYSSFVNTL